MRRTIVDLVLAVGWTWAWLGGAFAIVEVPSYDVPTVYDAFVTMGWCLFGSLLFLGLPAWLAFRRIPTPATLGGVLGGIWLGLGLLDAMHGRTLSDFRDALLGLPPVAVAAFVWAMRRRETRAFERAARPVAEGVWIARVDGVDVRIDHAQDAGPRRFFDRRAHVFSTPLPIGDATLRPPGLFVPGPWHYDGPAHLPAIWLRGEVPERLGRMLASRGARVEEGVLSVRTTAWLSDRRVAALLGEMAGVVGAVRASGRTAIARIQDDARSAPEAVARADAWRTLADHLPEGLAALAPEGVAHPDPLIRVIAARAVGDRAVLAAILAGSDDEEAVRRAVVAVRAEGWSDLVGAVAARLGAPPESAWLECVGVLGELGVRDHVARLREVAAGPGYAPELRALARDALARIRARLGGDAAGRLSVPGGEGGELALAAAGGELALAAAGGEVALAAAGGEVALAELAPSVASVSAVAAVPAVAAASAPPVPAVPSTAEPAVVAASAPPVPAVPAVSAPAVPAVPATPAPAAVAVPAVPTTATFAETPAGSSAP